MLEAEFAALIAAVLGSLLHPNGRRTALIFLFVLVAVCARRSLVVEEQPDAPLRLCLYRSGSGLEIETRRYRIHWQGRGSTGSSNPDRDD